MKKKLDKLVWVLIISLSLYVPVVNIIQALKCPKMTYTEVFLHLPKTFILKFDKCE